MQNIKVFSGMSIFVIRVCNCFHLIMLIAQKYATAHLQMFLIVCHCKKIVFVVSFITL